MNPAVYRWCLSTATIVPRRSVLSAQQYRVVQWSWELTFSTKNWTFWLPIAVKFQVDWGGAGVEARAPSKLHTSRGLHQLGRRPGNSMPDKTRIVARGPSERQVRTAEGDVLQVPANWELLPPGDAGLTRRVKAAGPSWTVKEKKGRRTFSLGVWAPAERIAHIRAELETERSTEKYAKRRSADAARRKKKQSAYVEDFRSAVILFLDFAHDYDSLARQLAEAVTSHATPVGSGTVARTQRIPIEQRAEAAVIAWMRHQTTAYDQMKIPRIKGKRREMRRMLAERSRRLLRAYRTGKPVDGSSCPLQQALNADTV